VGRVGHFPALAQDHLETFHGTTIARPILT
jgi:hypothetical protein